MSALTSAESLGSVNDIVMSPQTGKIAYLVISHGGFLGIDESYTPVPWRVLESAPGSNLLIPNVTKSAMESAPQISKDRPADFAVGSEKMKQYWAAHAAVAGK